MHLKHLCLLFIHFKTQPLPHKAFNSRSKGGMFNSPELSCLKCWTKTTQLLTVPSILQAVHPGVMDTCWNELSDCQRLYVLHFTFHKVRAGRGVGWGGGGGGMYVSIITTLHFKFWFKYDLRQNLSTKQLKFDPTGIRTRDLQIMTVHLMPLRRLQDH